MAPEVNLSDFSKLRPRVNCVAVKPREDLDPTSALFELSKTYRLTAATDDVGVVEVIRVGPAGVNPDGSPGPRIPFEPGDICLISFGEVRQGFVLDKKSYYVANFDSLFARLLPNNTVVPSLDYVITKQSPLRMTQAIFGRTDGPAIPPSILSGGIPSGEIRHALCPTCLNKQAFPEDKPSEPVTRIVYEEVVDAGPGIRIGNHVVRPDVNKGELWCFSVDFSVSFRMGGENYRAIRYANMLTAV